MKYYAIIVAGGTGNRMQSRVPKQFLLLNGKPVLMHAIEAFFRCEFQPQIITVLHPSLIDEWKALCVTHHFAIPHQLCEGGETRFHSVKNALKLITPGSITAIHDGARPIISAAAINASFKMAEVKGNAVTALKSTDSIRQVKNNTSIALNREEIYRVQTPQTFKSDILLNAYKQPYEQSFSDDATVVEKAGNTIYIIEGEPTNIKITYPGDLLAAEGFLKDLNQRRP